MVDNIIEVGEGPINAFLGARSTRAGSRVRRFPVRAILFTDLCDSTPQTQELGDEAFMDLLHDHDEIVRRRLGVIGVGAR